MPIVQELEARREAVLAEMKSIRSMTRGTITEQFLKVHRKGVREEVALGPYYVFSRHAPGVGKTRSRRLTSKEEVERVRGEIASHQRASTLRSWKRTRARAGAVTASAAMAIILTRGPRFF